MARTVLEIQTDLNTLTSAVSNLYLGKRITTLIVGSGAFQRRYTYQEISIENLNAQITRLQEELFAAQNTASAGALLPTFRAFSTLRFTCSKGTNGGGYE
jgi:uncharacterized coiled-coil protein SlyX